MAGLHATADMYLELEHGPTPRSGRPVRPLSVLEPPVRSRLIDGWLGVTIVLLIVVVLGHVYIYDLVQLVQYITRVFIAPMLGLAPAEPYW